jgi:SAM-dependent MidA family methyltransferase
VSRRPVPRPTGRGDIPRRWLTWSEATKSALYGHGGFYQRPEGPAAHFRTSVHASAYFARAVLALLAAVDAELGHPARLDLVDMGAGRGELLLAVQALLVAQPDLAGRVKLHAVELAERPPGLPDTIAWTDDLPESSVGLVVANEWLDNIPVDVVEAGPDGARRVVVDPASGDESPGGPVGLRDAGWLAHWWPLGEADEGERAEIGFPRDVAWGAAVRSLDRGLAVAIDYGHLRAERVAGAYATGTLTGYRDGRLVPPVPDGSCDLTAHVAMDSCESAGRRAGATSSVLARQADVLGALGLERSAPQISTADRLRHLSEAGELLDQNGLGAFWWLIQAIGIPLPEQLARFTT